MKKYITTLSIVTFLLLIILILVPKNLNGKTTTDIVSSIASIISPIIGVLSGYEILYRSNKIEQEGEDQYCKDMLESLILYTVAETEHIVNKILSISSQGSENGSRTITLPKDLVNIDQGFILVGKGLNRREDLYPHKQQSMKTILKGSHLSNLIYCDDWYKYLKPIKDLDIRNIITTWFLVLKSNDIKSYDLIVYRDKVIDILRTVNWVKQDIKNLKDTSELCDIYLAKCKKENIIYDLIVENA